MFKWIRPAAIVLAAGLIANTGFAQQRHAGSHGSQATQQHTRSSSNAHTNRNRARPSQARRAHPGARHSRPQASRRAYRGPSRAHGQARRHNRRFQGHQWQRNHRPSMRQGHRNHRPARNMRRHRRS